MIYSKLPKGKISISKIGLGTVQFGMDYGFTRAKSQKEVDEILERCITLGVNFLDTAREYGDSERKIGDFIRRHPNANFVIATKISKITKEVSKNKKELADYVLKSVKTSQKLLNTDRIDLLQLHQIDKFVVDNEYFWETVSDIKEKKFFYLFGVSVYDTETTENLINKYLDLIDFIQIPYNVFDQRFFCLFSLLEQKGIGIISRSTFLKGIIPAEFDKIPDELNKIKPYKEKLCAISQKAGLTVEELALLFVVSSKFIQATLVGVNSVEELETNIKVLENQPLLEKVYSEINELRVEDHFLIDPRYWRTI